MTLKIEDIIRVARLAKLKLDEHALPQYLRDLSNILSLMEQMSSVNTDHIEPITHPYEDKLHQYLRPDIVTETNQRDLFQSIAPAVEAGLYLVPKVIE